MIATIDSVTAVGRPAIVVNSRGIIQVMDPEISDFNESEEDLSISQEFPSWPCQRGSDYKASFVNFVNKTNLPLNKQDLLRIKRKIKDKIIALENSSYADLLAGPCLPIIYPRIEGYYYQEVVKFYWQRLDNNFRHKAELLSGPLRIRDEADFSFPLHLESFTVRLIFPQALPPLSSEGMLNFVHDLKKNHQLNFAGPLAMLCAMLTYPSIFKGHFRFFFPEFFVSYGEEYGQIPFFASNCNALSFQALRVVNPRAFDFCPLMF